MLIIILIGLSFHPKATAFVVFMLAGFAMANQMYYFIKWWDIKDKLDRLAPDIPQYTLEEGKKKRELWIVSQVFSAITFIGYFVYILV